ncbi:MAG: non-canonical purine NTP pyrophosphatase [Patescibacteria group bacterium]
MYIITGNNHKLEEYRNFFPDISSKQLDMPEIQSLDELVIQDFKIAEAKKHISQDFIVDDVAFYLDCLDGLPGPFIKWFNQTIKPIGLYQLAEQKGNFKASARCVVSYVDKSGLITHFQSNIPGRVVSPVSSVGFGFDTIFIPEGMCKTYSEMSVSEKNLCSHRGVAMQKLATALSQKL